MHRFIVGSVFFMLNYYGCVLRSFDLLVILNEWVILGSYLLYVSWADREVIGSPYRVNVIRGTADAQKVIFTGESLRVGGIVGQEISTMIDTRRAGPGECWAVFILGIL